MAARSFVNTKLDYKTVFITALKSLHLNYLFFVCDCATILNYSRKLFKKEHLHSLQWLSAVRHQILSVHILSIVILAFFIAMLSDAMLNAIVLNVIMLNATTLNVIILTAIVLNIIMLNVIILNVITLSVVAPFITHNSLFLQNLTQISKVFLKSFFLIKRHILWRFVAISRPHLLGWLLLPRCPVGNIYKKNFGRIRAEVVAPRQSLQQHSV